MKRRRVVLTIEAETVLTVRELRQLERMFFRGPGETSGRYLDADRTAEAKCSSLGTITQVQVNVVEKR